MGDIRRYTVVEAKTIGNIAADAKLFVDYGKDYTDFEN